MTEIDPGEAAVRDLDEARGAQELAALLLPDGISLDDVVDVVQERVNGLTRVIASMAGAKISVEIEPGHESQGQALIMGLPVIVSNAYNDLEEQ